MKALKCTLFLPVFLLTAVFAAETPAKRPLTAQDLWAFKRVGAPALSPDGKTVVLSVQEWSIDKNKSTANLWLVDVPSGKTRRLTAASAGDRDPDWSPDGSRIAFVSKRGDDEVDALYIMRTDGGEAERIVELPYAITTPRWMPDSKRIIAATRVIPELAGKLEKSDMAAMRKEIKRRKESKMTAKVTDSRQYRYWDQSLTDNLAHRLVLIDVESKDLKDLTPRWDRLFSVTGEAVFDLSPDGKQVAVAINSTPPPYRERPNSDIYLLLTDGSGTPKNITPENPSADQRPRFAPDGKSLVFARNVRPIWSGENERVWRHDFATGKNSPLTASLDYSFGEYAFSPDAGTLWLMAEDRGLLPLFKMSSAGGDFLKVYGAGTSTNLDAGPGAVVFLNETFHRPSELYVLDPEAGSTRQLTHFNDELLAKIDFGKVESFTFTGADGREIQQWVIYPPGYDPGKKYPLVQLLHGGPHTMVRDAFSYRWNAHLFAAPGYFVSWVNRHGSTGFGEAFALSIHGQWGEKPLTDIMRSTDYLLEKFPNIDRDRLAAAGASYGGYLAAWILGHSDRFKCIVDHAGVNNLYSQYGGDLTSYVFTGEILGGTPWENIEGMQRNNPMFYAGNFKTPTLIIHGEQDYRVPYGNGIELYGVLQAMGVPSRLVLFPNENHWVLSPQNSIFWNYEVQQWLARYIGGTPMAKPEFNGEGESD
ncbi:MAG: S9 family peptidase [Acidobacteria bacterium]|nr:MAG: S9 family peptidase [Acidobacteriota bacterium]